MQTWIRLRTNLDRVDEVIRLIDLLQVEKSTVIGCLYLFWAHCDENCRQGRVTLNARQIDRLTIQGFTRAMLKVGWLERGDGEFVIPRFNRYNPAPSKERTPKGVDSAPSKSTRRGFNQDLTTGKFRKVSPDPAEDALEDSSDPAVSIPFATAPLVSIPFETPLPVSIPFATAPTVSIPFETVPVSTPLETLTDENSSVPSGDPVNGDRTVSYGDGTVWYGDRTVPRTVAGTVHRTVKNHRTKAAATLSAIGQNRSRGTEKRRIEKRREEIERREEDRPPPDLGSVLGWAREAGIDESYARLWLAAVTAANFHDQSGAPIKNLKAYFRVCGERWRVGSGPPQKGIASKVPAAPVAKPARAAWQVEKDLRTVEERLKKTSTAWRPNPDDIKVLSAEKKRLHRELIELLKSQSDEKCS